MPRLEHVLSVFVASPSDVVEEREKLDNLIQEFNISWARDQGIRLELIKWETHTAPDFGIDAQNVINRQIGDEYDIFIGIMWSRFGSPTGRADSGTAEEFQRAKKRFDKDANSVTIMMYFKDAPISPSKMDPKQLTKVQEFRASISEGLYSNFDSAPHFEKLLRLHLTKNVQIWRNRIDNSQTITQSGKPTTTLAVASVEDVVSKGELGILEYQEIGAVAFAEISSCLDTMTSSAGDLGVRIQAKGMEIEYIRKTQSQEQTKREARRIFDETATIIAEFNFLFERALGNYKTSFDKGSDAIIKLIALSTDFPDQEQNRNELKEFIEVVTGLMNAIALASDNTLLFANGFQSLPRFTLPLNREKAKAVNLISDLQHELRNSVALLTSIIEACEERINSI